MTNPSDDELQDIAVSALKRISETDTAELIYSLTDEELIVLIGFAKGVIEEAPEVLDNLF